ncbi:Z-ring formation inhibitor MciZ [Paenibacillus pini]|nr:Z-ring formation inhibitor MciZ [Paenibacillus pini]
MKSYRNSNSFHMVGQAWQIKIMLAQWQKEWGPHTPIQQILNNYRTPQ